MILMMRNNPRRKITKNKINKRKVVSNKQLKVNFSMGYSNGIHCFLFKTRLAESDQDEEEEPAPAPVVNAQPVENKEATQGSSIFLSEKT